MTAVFTEGVPRLIEFDAAAHVYTVGGRVIPNVTGMLQKTGWVDPTYYTDAVRERGNLQHHRVNHATGWSDATHRFGCPGRRHHGDGTLIDQQIAARQYVGKACRSTCSEPGD